MAVMAEIGPNQDLRELLLTPRETLDIEVKEWLDLSTNDHRAALAKEVIALANHGGGYLVAGFEEYPDGTFAVSAVRTPDLAAWSQDAVQAIVAKYVDPEIQCRVVHELSVTGQRHPIIAVPGGHRVPIRAKAGSPDGKLVPNRVYIRRPGPNSEEPRTAEEWDRLLERIMQNRKAELLEAMRSIMDGAIPTARTAPTPSLAEQLLAFEQHAATRWQARIGKLVGTQAPPAFTHGFYDVGFAIDATIDHQSLADLRDTIASAVRNHSGWPPFLTLHRQPFEPAAVENAVEMWIGPDADGSFDRPAHHDFWRVAPTGFLFTRRGYGEDGGVGSHAPGTTLDITTPTWRLGEAILEAVYIAQRLGGGGGNLICHATWTGLTGRKLVSIGNPNRIFFGDYVCQQSRFETSRTFAVAAALDVLPEIVWAMLSGLYELFGFYRLPKTLVEQELATLRSRTF
jgi:hypothetical protein